MTAYPTKHERWACAGCYAALAFIAWAVAMPHSWNGGV
jgi:hypothetical protein